MKIAAAAWKVRQCRSDGDFFGHMHDVVSAAYDLGAEVVVLPEYTVLELLGIEPALAEHRVPDYLVQYAEALEGWLLRISASAALTIVGGSHFKRRDSGKIGNACAVASPDGRLAITWKNKLTVYEREIWRLEEGSGLKRLQDFRLGVLVCYDVEFPDAARNLAEEGAEALLVPAFTDRRAGFQRVRWCCHARAVENQAFVVHSSLVGGLGREPLLSSYGTSAILTPSMDMFPEKAVLAETDCNEEGLAVADLDFALLTDAREHGSVRNWQDRYPNNWTVG
jgi:predicted amidohydrolase